VLAARRTRPIPADATFHGSVLQRRQRDYRYLPDMSVEQQQRSAEQPDWTLPPQPTP
jgi:hypothetical protein